MAITFPRALPYGDIWRDSVTFDLVYQQTTGITGGARQQVANIGRDYWRMSYETVPLHPTVAKSVEAWALSLRGGVNLFLAWHPAKRYLDAYRRIGYGGLVKAVGGAVFSGTGALVSVSSNIVTVDGLPASMPFRAGDMLSIAYASGHHGLHLIVEGATTSGSGQVAVSVEPAVLPGYAAGDLVSIEKAACRAVIDARSIRTKWVPGGRCAVAFQASQTF